MLRRKTAVDDSLRKSFDHKENHRNRRAAGWRALWGVLVLLCAGSAKAQTNIVTQHYDNSRTGANTNETILTPANVNSNTFGKLFSYLVNGQVYAQPLYISGVTMGAGTSQAGTTHNVVFVATEHDSVYAFDTDSNTGANASPLWQISLLDSAHGAVSGATTVPTASGDDIYPEIGITGTPVIDPTTGTLYVVAATQESGTYVQRLHALDIATGGERTSFNGPIQLQASVQGTGNGSSGGVLNFDPYWENQRAGLLLLNGIVYIGYGSHNDLGPWHGWILAYNGRTLQQTGVFCATPNGTGAGIWMSGSGLAADVIDPVNHPYGRMFVPTGNGSFNAIPPYTTGMSFSDDIIRLDLANGALTPVDSFTPLNQNTLNSADKDTASGGVVLLPDQSAGGHTHLLVQTGKEGRIFLVDRDNMGGYSATSDAIVQEIPPAPSTTGYQINGIWGAPVYWNGNIYFWTSGDHLKAFSLTNGLLSATYTSRSNETISYPGSTPVVSASGNTNGIVWAIDAGAYSPPGPAILQAHDALNTSTLLYSSSQILSRDNPGNAVKFSVPTVVNGMVYVGTQNQLSVYGLLAGLPAAAAPTFSPPGASYSAPQTVSISDTTPGAVIYYTTDGTTPTTSSTLYSGALTVGTGEMIEAIAVASGFKTSPVAAATYTFPAANGGQIQINSGGSAAGSFVTDVDFGGGNASSVTFPIDTSAVTNPAPQAVYQTERWGVFSYTIPNLTPSSAYKVRLHFAELAFGSPGQRIFNVAINGTTVLTNFDIFVAAGGSRKAVIEEFTPTTDVLGRITISYQKGSADYPKSSGIEIITLSTSSDFTVAAAPSSQSVVAGGKTTFTVNVGALNGFSGTVGLSVSGLPTGATASFNPSAIGPGASSTLTLTTASSTPVGASTLTITGASGSLTHATTVSLNVTAAPDFTISATPSSQTVTVGSSTTYTVNVGALNGFSGAVGLSVSGLPTGATAGFNPTSLTGSGTSTLTVTTTSSTPVGSPSLTITGTSGSLSHTATVTLVVNALPPAPDFSITATPSSQSVNAGISAAYTVNVGALNGFSGTVGLSVGGLPTGTTAALNPTSVNTSGSSTLTVNTTSTTPGGTYTLVVTGTSGSITHTVSVSLLVSVSGQIQINSGGGAAGSFIADVDFSGGNAASVTSTIDTSAFTNPAPQAVYQTERWGVFTYTIPNLTPSSAYKVRLHFAELAFSAPGKRIFNVVINGTTVLTNFDIFAAAGGSRKAVIEEFTPTTDVLGRITISYQKGTADYPKSSGIEIIPLGTPSPDFTVTATPSSQSVVAGGNTTYTVNVGALNGFSGTVGLSVGGLPTGATAAFNPTSVNTSGSSSLTVNTTSTTPGGTYTLVVTGTSGSVAHTVSVSLTVNVSGQIQINSGGSAAGSFVADVDFSGGNASSVTFPIDTSAVTNPAPQAVYQTERWGVFSYTIPNLTPSSAYKVRLHFAELAFGSPGQRIFNVAINGATVLTNFDIVATAGGGRKALIKEFTPTANANGQITISYQKGSADYPKSSGIEIIPQ